MQSHLRNTPQVTITVLNTKIKGGLGVCKVVEHFLRLGIPVFTELFCDNSEVDLIVIVDGKTHKIQVRSASSKNHKVELRLQRTTPGTRNTACKITGFSDSVDMFALYVEDKDTILFIHKQDISQRRCVIFDFSLDTKGRKANDYLVPKFVTS